MYRGFYQTNRKCACFERRHHGNSYLLPETLFWGVLHLHRFLSRRHFVTELLQWSKKQLAFRNIQQLVVVSFFWVVVLFVCLFIFVAACGGFFFFFPPTGKWGEAEGTSLRWTTRLEENLKKKKKNTVNLHWNRIVYFNNKLTNSFFFKCV